MIFIKEINIDIPEVNQKFELGDLTIFIGRPNCGKTRILQKIYDKANEAEAFLKAYSRNKNKNMLLTNLTNHGMDFDSNKYEDEFHPKIIPSQRQNVRNIDAYSSGFEKISGASKKMDPTITEIGNNEVNQKGLHRSLNIQGSGIQNMVQIFSGSFRPNFFLIDEPEISQFPSGKVEMLKHILDLSKEKQILFATHDPTLINQYIIKKHLGDKNRKIIVYSFCNNKFSKIDFTSNLNPEIHCGYLSQTLSGKPIHLIFEGQTEFYLFQALLHRYCLEKNKNNIAKRLNRVSLSFLGGDQWKINIHHIPDPHLYGVLVIMDGDKEKEFDENILPNEVNKIKSVKDIVKGKLNLIFLKANDIEDAFEGVYTNMKDLSKPFQLSEVIWKMEGEVIKDLEKSEKSKQLCDILEWALSNRD